MFSFCTFVERISPTRVKLHFTTCDGAVDLYVDIEHTQRCNFKNYTRDQWDAFDFEDMQSRPCIMMAYRGSEYAEIFAVPRPDDDVHDVMKFMLNTYRKDLHEGNDMVFTNPQTSKQWIDICVSYLPELGDEIQAAVAKKLNVASVTDSKLDAIKEIVDVYTNDPRTAELLKNKIIAVLNNENMKEVNTNGAHAGSTDVCSE